MTRAVTASVGWLGAIAAYIALNVPALTSTRPQTVRAAYLMMEPVAVYAIVPLALTALITGIVQALGTPWGLARHYWVLISLVLTAFAALVLIGHLPQIHAMATAAADPTAAIRTRGDLFHSVGGLIVLLIPLWLNMYKPRGLTRYGWRKQQRIRTASRHPTAEIAR